MASSFGYSSPTYGYKPPKPKTATTSLEHAAAGAPTAADPFGLLTDTTDSARVARNATPKTGAQTIVKVAPTTSVAGQVAAPNTQVAGATSTAPVAPKAYDINTDPALQQADSLIGLNDEQARAQALEQKKQLLENYGDPGLAAAVLGGNDPTVTASGQNPFSTRAQLGTQRDRNLHDLTEQLNQANLLYSGYRTTQEQQAGHDYQDQLAQAASAANSGLGSIDANLAAALASGNTQRATALTDAYGRHATDVGAAAPADTTGDPGAGGAGAGGAGDTASGGGLEGLTAPDYLTALALAARTRRSVAL